MAALTIITPIAPQHVTAFAQCAESVAGQTVRAQHLYMVDHDGRGPAAIRNLLLSQVTTDLVTFLDADDWVEPTFAEQMLRAVRPARYAYSDWFQDGKIIQAPDCAWINHTFHLVTAVIPTAWVRAVGGFDESLSGMEDTDLFLKLVTQGMCGQRLAIPLVHYRKGGGRADSIHRSGEIDILQAEINRRYGGLRVGCCGGQSEPDLAPVGEKRAGDVLATALWGGNRTVVGMATGRHYPRTGNYKREWVDPRDVRAAPHMWQLVPESFEDTPEESAEPEPLKGVMALEARLLQANLLRIPKPAAPVPVAVAAPIAPIANVRKVRRLAGAERGLPVFVGATRDYPSYSDFFRLADLAGFSARRINEIDLNDPAQTYIFVTPEGIPDCSEAAAHTIFWQFEYAGKYANQVNRQTAAEQWSSDPAHARATGARYVLLGSHPGLNYDLKRGDPVYDLVMLAYLTKRRQAVKAQLVDRSWAPEYPGHTGLARHEILKGSRLMLHVHQHDRAACAPIRYALAAAYSLPIVAERVPEVGPYGDAIMWADYEQIPTAARLFLDGKPEADATGKYLHYLLCVERRFDIEVLRALETSKARIAA